MFAILGKEGGEARFVREGAGCIVFWLERLNLRELSAAGIITCAKRAFAYLPLVDVIRIPRLIFLMCRRHDLQ